MLLLLLWLIKSGASETELIRVMTKAGLISQERGARQVEAILEIYNIQEEISIKYRASQSIDGPLTLLCGSSLESLLKVHESHGKLSHKGFSCYLWKAHIFLCSGRSMYIVSLALKYLIYANSCGAIKE